MEYRHTTLNEKKKNNKANPSSIQVLCFVCWFHGQNLFITQARMLTLKPNLNLILHHAPKIGESPFHTAFLPYPLYPHAGSAICEFRHLDRLEKNPAQLSEIPELLWSSSGGFKRQDG